MAGETSPDVTKPKRYPPVGRCIYCGRTEGLTDEHIVPLALNGAWILPKSTCPRCSKITAQIETAALHKTYLGYRIQKDFRTRRRKQRNAKRIKVTRRSEGKTEVFYDDFKNAPVFLMHMRLQPPTILTNKEPPKGHSAMSMLIATDIRHFVTTQKLASGEFISEYNHKSVARMLAKIAHAYACAELGLGRFNPLLPGLILGEVEWVYNYLVGGDYVVNAPHTPLPKLPLMHSLHLTSEKAGSGKRFYVAKIRLFAYEVSPVYTIIVGQKTGFIATCRYWLSFKRAST